MELTDVKRSAYISGLMKASMESVKVRVCLVSFLTKSLEDLETEFNDAVRNDPETTGRNYLEAFKLMSTASFDIRHLPGFDSVFVAYANKFNYYPYTGENLQQALLFIKLYAEYCNFEMTREREDLLTKIFTPALSEEDVASLMDNIKKFVGTFE